ncbi:MAG: 6-phosphogluconolactonase [Anaerolineaceae bacterium]|nr:6-phosphogluconolactonase [Anaerolineaceae bacterium]
MPDSAIQTFSSVNSLTSAGAHLFHRAAQQALEKRGRFLCVLAGGGTPIRLYETLAAPPFRNTIDWRNVHFFWGDERCVPPEHPESNYNAAFQALLKPLKTPPTNIHRIRGELAPELAVQDYTQQLQEFAPSELAVPPWPAFDLVLLGMGEDGHIASIFPDTEESTLPVIAVTAHYQGRPAGRVSLTPRVFNHALHILFLVTGKNKASALLHSLTDPQDPLHWPVQRIKPSHGSVTWLVDSEAASALPDSFHF